MRDGDTIVALSSGSVPAGVAIVRISGPDAAKLVTGLAGTLPAPRQLSLRSLRHQGQPLDQGLVAWFPGPHSFTGEDCAELHLHGSPAVLRAVLRALTGQAGTRLAEAGEFTRRAFENGRLDLTEVDGLGDLIVAETENQRQQALARLAGGLSAQLEDWRERLLDARAEIEAQLDFSDEGDVGELPPTLRLALEQLQQELVAAIAGVAQGRIVREGLRVALAGAPNAGKSSLLNALARSEVAIVTAEAGTTRDVKEVAINLDGQLVVLVDMAGLRDTDSLAEAEGVRRARQEIANADLVLWLVAPDAALPDGHAGGASTQWTVATKADLGHPAPTADLQISVRTGHGLDALLARLQGFVQTRIGTGEPALVSRERDRVALAAAVAALGVALERLDQSEIAAEQLRIASQAMERLLGRMDAESVLDQLFARFCIGK